MGGQIVSLFRRRVASNEIDHGGTPHNTQFFQKNVFCFWDIGSPNFVLTPRLIDPRTARLPIEVSSSPVQTRNFPRSLAIRQIRNGGRYLDSDRPSVQGQYDAGEEL